MKKRTTPPHLVAGDKAVIISPAGSTDPIFIDAAKRVLTNWGLDVSLSANALGEYGRYSAPVKQRLLDLQDAMDDDLVRLIFCARGGYGVVHLLDKLNFSKIRASPKWLVGYSDITALHLAFCRQGLVSLHAPMARHLAELPDNQSSIYLKDTLFSQCSVYKIPSHELNKKGLVQGTLFGGNLAVLAGLIGTAYMKVPQKGILFIEDIAETPYKVDRMMWNLKLSGILGKLSGLIVGQFAQCEEDTALHTTIYELIKDITQEYNYPLAFDFPVGHVDVNYPMMHGTQVLLSVGNELVEFKNIQ